MSQIIPIYIPTYINNAEYAPARVLPRLLYYNGLLDCQTYYIDSGSLTKSGVAKEQNAFPYFDNYNVVTGSFPTEDSDSLLFNNEQAAYGFEPTENLYTKYWSRYIDLLYNPYTRLLNCSAIIPLADYFNMELNDIVQFRGNLYHLRAINNYSLKNGTCELQLLGPILNDVISAINPELSCDFDFSFAENLTPTTTLVPTTAVPTTTIAPTTAVPTTTLVPTTLVPTTATPTITPTIAPTTSTTTGTPTVAPTTLVPTTLTPTVTPTVAPTTSTTTATPTATPTTLTPTTLTPTTLVPTTTATPLSINYLVVAGGGGGGAGTGGGGGAGGFSSGSMNVTPATYNVVVGQGGIPGSNGESSSFYNISTLGGGYGGDGASGGTINGGVGGSGGGASGGVNGGTTGAAGTAGQGFAGGQGRQYSGVAQNGGGGGGAGQVGGNYSPFGSLNYGAGDGGNGKAWLDGNFYAGGGGGYYSGTGDRAGAGGAGGGGRGSSFGVAIAVTGSVNTGGGGGGGYSSLDIIGKAGGSGIVIVRYAGSGSQATGGTISYSGSYTYHTFTSSGNFIYP